MGIYELFFQADKMNKKKTKQGLANKFLALEDLVLYLFK